ncbi:MAG: permease [Fibrobacteria bacterium]|nr:permease [Fibrobacteria bacterium]
MHHINESLPLTFLINIWNVFAEMAPWLLLGSGIAGILHVFLPANFIHRHLGASKFSNVVKAVVFGIPMPLCSCGVIPAAIGLKKDGASDGASIGFLISTPQTGVDSIFVSASFLGWPFALFKVFSALITGLIGGGLVNMADSGSHTNNTSKIETTDRQILSLRDKLTTFNHFVFGDLIYGIWKVLVIGILVSAAITTFIPPDSLANSPFISGFTGKIVILVFSLGLYVCATGSVPIAASLVFAGMPVGSALVFLMAGPATNAATMGAVLRTFGKKTLFIYLAVISVGSILLGELFDMGFGTKTMEMLMHHHEPSVFFQSTGGLFLLLILWYAFSDTRNFFRKKLSASSPVNTHKEFIVEGMTCEMCVRKVKNTLTENSNVSSVTIDLETKKVTVAGTDLEDTILIPQIIAKGYKVI